jgi:ATP-dependent protease ClpP protease subunit
VEAPILVCDRDIAPNDVFAEMFDESQPVFSSTTVREFLDANKEATEIVLEVRSDGGSTSEARIIYDMLKGCGKTITTHGYKVNSSAMILFLAGENRLISQNSDSIIHPVWVDAFGLPWQLEADDLRLFADEIDSEQVKLVDIYCSVIGEDKRVEVTQLMAETTNLSCDESIRLGFATGKLEGKSQPQENKRSVVYTNKMFAAAMLNKKNQTEMAKEENARYH